MRFALVLSAALVASVNVMAQDPNSPPPSPREKWKFFLDETFTPLTVGAGLFNASLSQATLSQPKYGAGWGPYGERYGAATADIATQNFFGDYAMASVLHEDTRYVRKGERYGFWSRVGHAAASGFVTRKDSGEPTFNWANLSGTAMSVGLSNAYYPPASRNGGAIAVRFVTNLAGNGFSNVAPEFWPDVHRWMTRHHLARGSK